MKQWFFALTLVVVGSVNAWTSDGYATEIRSTIAELDAHYTQEIKAVYTSGQMDIPEKKARVLIIQNKWTAQRLQVVRDMQKTQAELKHYEDRQLNSSIQIRAKLQQTLGEIQQWRNAELGHIQTLQLSPEAKARGRFEINRITDERSNQVQASALLQEQALRKLNDRADKPMFSSKNETSAFALTHNK